MSKLVCIVVNGRRETLDVATNITQLLVNKGYHNRPVAVEVNERVVPRSQHADYYFLNEDNVEIVQAIGGG